jgi:glycosyltransferase involved in cell wall biosynthesis
VAERPLTILQLLPALQSGGVERGTLEVARELVRKGHRSLVISAGGGMVENLVQEGSEHFSWKIGRKIPPPLHLIHRLRHFLNEQRVDLLHARSRMPAWIGYLATRYPHHGWPTHFVTTVHGFNSPGKYSSIMVRGERVIAVSRAVNDYIFHHYPWLQPERVTVIPRGIDPRYYPYGYRPGDDWCREWFRQYPQLLDHFVITLPGRISRLKGHIDFIRIMTELYSRQLPVTGLIVGGADRHHQRYLKELQQRVATLGLNIIFTGQRNDLREILAVSNLVLSLSGKPESFGRTVLEALSLGTPVIGYDHGGVGEILGEIFPEGRVAPGNWRAMTDRIAHQLNCRQRVATNHPFTLERMVGETLDLYNGLCGSQQP